MRIGVIAEDVTDVSVLRELISKILGAKSFSIKRFTGGGSGGLRKKCTRWVELLVVKQCDVVIVMHDLDREAEPELRERLERSVRAGSEGPFIVLIPVTELEAWLLSDADALARVFKMRRHPKLPGEPETIDDPKKYLKRLVWRATKKRYVPTVHNQKIASAAALSRVKKRASFASLPKFLLGVAT